MLEKRAPDVAGVGDTLRSVARDIIGEARDALTAPGRTDAVAVHDYRKAMKRWRALLRLLAPFVGPQARELRTEARDLARLLAGARDGQSAIEALDDLTGNDVLSARSMATIRGRLEGMRKVAEARSLTAEIRARIMTSLDTAAVAVEQWRLGALEFSDVARRLAENYRKVRRARPRDWEAADAETLHDLRTLVVVHRYQMEIVEPLWPKLGRLWVAETQRLRDRLGRHHDLAMLQDLTAPHRPLAPWRSRLTPLIEARQRKLAKSSSKLAGRLLAETPKAFRKRLEALWEHRYSEDD